MMKFLRSQSQTVLVFILAVIGLGFFFYGNSGNFLSSGGGGPTDFGRIDGEDLSVADLYGAVRNERAVLALRPPDQMPTQAAIAEEAWTRLLLLHEATKLHIVVPDDAKTADAELSAYIQKQPLFQRNGVYSPDMLNLYLQLTHLSFNSYAALMQEQMRIEAVYHALFSSIHAAGGDAAALYEKNNGPVQISYVSFAAAPFAAAAKPGAAEIEAAYKADPMNPAYRTQEQRQVEYVLFPLTADQQKLPDKDKNAAIQALGEKALDFALALQPDPSAGGTTPPVADFQAEARKRGLTPITTNLFAANSLPAGMAPSPAFNNAVFSLTKEDPISKVVALDNGVVVMRLVRIEPSELKPLAEVTPVIVKDLQQKQGGQAQTTAAAAVESALRAAMKKGTDFKTAAAQLHLSVQTLPAFVPEKAPTGNMLVATLGYVSAGLSVGEISRPVPIESDRSVAILHVDARAQADPAGLADFQTRYRSEQESHLQQAALNDWADWMSHQPGTRRPPHLEAYGGVE